MHWSERIVLCFCRFIFLNYHKCVTSSRGTCLHRYCTSFFTLFRFTSLSAQVIALHWLAHAVTYVSCYLHIDLRVVIRTLTHLTKVFYRALLFIFWASVVQSYLSYIVPRYSTYEGNPLGLGLLAGFHFSRFLEELSSLESRAVPCIYLPISITFSDTWLLLKAPYVRFSSIEEENLAVRLLQSHCLALSCTIEEFFGQGLFTRVPTILLALLICVLTNSLCQDPARSMEWKRTSRVLPRD